MQLLDNLKSYCGSVKWQCFFPRELTQSLGVWNDLGKERDPHSLAWQWNDHSPIIVDDDFICNVHHFLLMNRRNERSNIVNQTQPSLSTRLTNFLPLPTMSQKGGKAQPPDIVNDVSIHNIHLSFSLNDPNDGVNIPFK